MSSNYPVYPMRSRRPRIPDGRAVALGVDCSDPDPANWTYYGDQAEQAASEAAEQLPDGSNGEPADQTDTPAQRSLAGRRRQ